jgi:transposase-like protein
MGGEWILQVPKHSTVPDPAAAAAGEMAHVPPRERDSSMEVVAKKTRRRFSASEKLRILKAADAALASGERGAVEKLLRREGLYSSHLTVWRQQFASRGSAGLESLKPGRKRKLDEKDRQLVALTKRAAELERKLAISNALLDLQKKAHEILGMALPESDGGS